MRFFIGLVLALALGVMGCSEAPGNCGYQGQGGGAAWIYPGLYRASWDGASANYRACVFVNEDCTALQPSTECDIGDEDSGAHFLAVEWTDGRNENNDECAASVSVTTDLVGAIPIEARTGIGASFSFYVEFSDDDGAAWEIFGDWSYDHLRVSPRRVVDDLVCRPHVDYPSSVWCIADAWDLCLERE